MNLIKVSESPLTLSAEGSFFLDFALGFALLEFPLMPL